jgi:hypothetical protein
MRGTIDSNVNIFMFLRLFNEDEYKSSTETIKLHIMTYLDELRGQICHPRVPEGRVVFSQDQRFKVVKTSTLLSFFPWKHRYITLRNYGTALIYDLNTD